MTEAAPARTASVGAKYHGICTCRALASTQAKGASPYFFFSIPRCLFLLLEDEISLRARSGPLESLTAHQEDPGPGDGALFVYWCV